MSSHVHTVAESLPPAGIGSYYRGLPCRHSRASVRSRPVEHFRHLYFFWTRNESQTYMDVPDGPRRPSLSRFSVSRKPSVYWRRNVRYTHPLFGKLVIEPPPAVQDSKTVTFWPARERLRIAKRPTRTGQDMVAFQQALADQGHRIPGHVSRRARPSKSARLSKEKRLRARREADLAEMEHAHALLMARCAT